MRRQALDRVRRLRADGIARDAVWGTGMEALQLAVMLLSFTLLGKRLGPSGFGDYAAMYALIGILGGLVYSGVTLSVIQHLVQGQQELAAVLRSSLGLVLAAGTAAVVLGAAVGQVTVPGVSVLVLVSFLLAELLGTATVETLAAAVYAREGVAVAVRYRVVPLVAKFSVLLLLFAADRLTIAALGTAYLIMYPVIAVGTAVAVGRRYGTAVRPGRPSLEHLRSSGLYSVTISGLTLQNDGDKLVLSANRAGAETGLYAAAYRLVSFGMLPLRALLTASHRRFLEHDPGQRGQHVRRAVRFSAVGVAYGVLFAAGLALVAPLVTLLLGPEYADAVPMLRALALVVAVRACAEFGLNGLLGFGRVGLRTVVTLVAAATALLCYVLLIPLYGWRGAVAGTYVSELVLAGVAWSALVVQQRRHDAALARPARPPAEQPAAAPQPAGAAQQQPGGTG